MTAQQWERTPRGNLAKSLGDWPGPILHLASVDSTQTLARKMAVDGAPSWSLILADRQTQGRGRMARKWSSRAGGVYLSLILRPPMRPNQLAKLSLDTADAVARTLTKATGLQTAVKPPNDVLARSLATSSSWKKVCGILVEASGDSKKIDWIVIGVGINANNRVPRNLQEAGSLSQLSGRTFDIQEVCRKTLKGLLAMLDGPEIKPQA